MRTFSISSFLPKLHLVLRLPISSLLRAPVAAHGEQSLRSTRTPCAHTHTLKSHRNLFYFAFVCLSVLANGVTEDEHEDLGGQEEFGGQYREFDPENLNYEQEFAEDTDGGKSNLIPFDAY